MVSRTRGRWRESGGTVFVGRETRRVTPVDKNKTGEPAFVTTVRPGTEPTVARSITAPYPSPNGAGSSAGTSSPHRARRAGGVGEPFPPTRSTDGVIHFGPDGMLY